jgi:endogenous inhibitor of DNA gyrase (YacG/DUF329 family)
MVVEIKSGHVLVKCKCCQKEFQARIADRKRGWGKFCSKRCKAINQEGRTGQYRNYLSRRTYEDVDYEGDGWDAHKDIF